MFFSKFVGLLREPVWPPGTFDKSNTSMESGEGTRLVERGGPGIMLFLEKDQLPIRSCQAQHDEGQVGIILSLKCQSLTLTSEPNAL
jgi:hypothetical protein